MPEPMPPPYSQAQHGQTLASSPVFGVQPTPATRTVSEPDAITALNILTRLDPAQQRAVVSVLNSLLPQEEPSTTS